MPSPEQIVLERQLLYQTMRKFFWDRGFVEVETPLVVRSPGMEPNLCPFETIVIEPNGTRYNAGLITSPEYAMKKLLGLGMQKIFTLTKVFRNEEELGGSHNPEFTMLEWYVQGADYQACMDETQALMEACAIAFQVSFPAFERKRVRDLLKEYAGVDLDTATTEDLKKTCVHLGIHTDSSDTESDLFYRLFLTKVEPTFFSGATFVYDYPISQAALSQLTENGKYGQRFELYINGLELCNGFTELVDAQEQHQRFIAESQERLHTGKTIFPIDETLLRLLPSVQSPSYGNALGVDRLHMVLTGRPSIADVLLFPAASLFKNET
jgi:lysyl-tRNA synthetase class 2